MSLLEFLTKAWKPTIERVAVYIDGQLVYSTSAVMGLATVAREVRAVVNGRHPCAEYLVTVSDGDHVVAVYPQELAP